MILNAADYNSFRKSEFLKIRVRWSEFKKEKKKEVDIGQIFNLLHLFLKDL